MKPNFRRRWAALAWLAPLPALVVAATLETHPTWAAEEGFTPLFDGKTLGGWTINCLPKDREFAAKA